jgi:small-conductance mechanosensitive channel
MSDLLKDWQVYIWLLAAVVLGLICHFALFKTAQYISRNSKTVIDDLLVKHCRAPSRLIIPLIFVHFLSPLMDISGGLSVFIKQIFAILFIISIAWLIIKLSCVLEDFIIHQFSIDTKDNLRARMIQTQLLIFKKVVSVIVGLLGMAFILMNFEKIRYLGTSILASAGIAGVIIGFAAQRSIGTLIAGIQIAITQPIRLDDVVIVENEWGRIEEITLTYVAVRIWDLRRLIVPINYFIEKPFQNWTRKTADILGTIFIYVDYTVPVNRIREELYRILEESELWDRKVYNLQVTNATEHTLELRALVSASDASKAWNLRCEVREKMIEFIQKNYPQALPKYRTELFNEERKL